MNLNEFQNSPNLEFSDCFAQGANNVELFNQTDHSSLLATTPSHQIKTMSEKLCLQWNDFKENVNSAFRKLRGKREFTDVTLVCEDGQQVEAHKVILASSSPFFEKLLQKSKHPHPLIYLRGFQSKDFTSILDFLYFGEANVYQEDLDSFLAITEVIQLKGLTGQTSQNIYKKMDLLEEQEKVKQNAMTGKDSFATSITGKREPTATANTDALGIRPSKGLPIQDYPGTDLSALEKKVKSLMEKGQNMIPSGAQGVLRRSIICKMCGKEGLSKHIRDHIEANHLEGISIPCGSCGKTFSSRGSLGVHEWRFHR